MSISASPYLISKQSSYFQLFRLCYHNILLFLGLVPLSVSSFSWQVSHFLCHLYHLNVSKAIKASPSQLYTMASLGLHSGITLTYACPQLLSLVEEANSQEIPPFFSLLVLEPVIFCCLLGLQHNLLVQLHIHKLSVFMVSFAA